MPPRKTNGGLVQVIAYVTPEEHARIRKHGPQRGSMSNGVRILLAQALAMRAAAKKDSDAA